jgi:hypothetical protein
VIGDGGGRRRKDRRNQHLSDIKWSGVGISIKMSVRILHLWYPHPHPLKPKSQIPTIHHSPSAVRNDCRCEGSNASPQQSIMFRSHPVSLRSRTPTHNRKMHREPAMLAFVS